MNRYKINKKHDWQFDISEKISQIPLKTKLRLLLCKKRYTNDTYKGYMSEIAYKVLDNKIYILKSKVW